MVKQPNSNLRAFQNNCADNNSYLKVVGVNFAGIAVISHQMDAFILSIRPLNLSPMGQCGSVIAVHLF